MTKFIVDSEDFILDKDSEIIQELKDEGFLIGSIDDNLCYVEINTLHVMMELVEFFSCPVIINSKHHLNPNYPSIST